MTDFSQSECQRRVALLSPQLREVLKRMAQGLATKQIADELQLSITTVQVYRERLYSKLGVNNLALAIRIAVGAKLV